MRKTLISFILLSITALSGLAVQAEEGDPKNTEPVIEAIADDGQALGQTPIPEAKQAQSKPQSPQYTVGVEDILEISVLQPDEILHVVNVGPDGTISFPYIGSVMVKDLTVPQIQEKIQMALADGYLKYPVVLVALQESRSRNFFVYGEVTKPGSYALVENTTVLRAISMAGGFTKFGSSSRVKVLRPKENEPGYNTIKLDIKNIMNGDTAEDIILKPGDMIVVSEGVF